VGTATMWMEDVALDVEVVVDASGSSSDGCRLDGGRVCECGCVWESVKPPSGLRVIV
jgi:hypothetical protein